MKMKMFALFMCGLLVSTAAGCGSTSANTSAEADVEIVSAQAEAPEEEIEEEAPEISATEEAAAEEAEFLADLQANNPDLYEGYMEIAEMVSYAGSGYTALDRAFEDDETYHRLDDAIDLMYVYYSVDRELFGYPGSYIFAFNRDGDYAGEIAYVEFMVENSNDFYRLWNDLSEMLGEDCYDNSDGGVYKVDYSWDMGTHVCIFDYLKTDGLEPFDHCGIYFIANPDYDTINPDFTFKYKED